MSCEIYVWDKNLDLLCLTNREFRDRLDAHGEYCVHYGRPFLADVNGQWIRAKSDELLPEFRAILLLEGITYKE